MSQSQSSLQQEEVTSPAMFHTHDILQGGKLFQGGVNKENSFNAHAT